MTMLAAVTNKNGLMTLADYEARIHLYKEQIGVGYIGIGRTLIEAKEAEVVPHGDWETWVTRTTGLNPRQAQRCMQAAREIKDGSALAQLEMSKALMVLSSGLDDDTQEQLAIRAAEDGATVKELRAEIKKIQREKEQYLSIAAEYRKTAERVDTAEQTANEMRIKLETVRTENMSLRGQIQGARDYVEVQVHKAKEEARSRASEDVKHELDELRADLEAAEAREAMRAGELEQLRHEHQQRAMDDARGIVVSGFTGFDLAAAVRAFIGSAGVLPQMGNALRHASPEEREIIRQNIDTVAAWVDGARAAMGIFYLPSMGEYDVK